MLSLNLVDKMFSGPSAGSNLNEPNPYIEWIREYQNEDFVVVTDNSLKDPARLPFKHRIAWLFESPNPKIRTLYRMRKKWRFREFEKVFTYDKRLLDCGNKFAFCPLGGSWIKREDWMVYPKSTNLSILASPKNDLPGHQLRHKVIAKHQAEMDGLFGNPHNFVKDKIDALRDFRYSIVIENQRLDYYFSEKIIDAFASGTVPIYWGCPSLGKFFNMDGIIHFETLEELEMIIPTLSQDDYERRLPAIIENFASALEYRIPENGLHDGLLKHPALMAHFKS
ncbi:MAG: hypothetical protein V3V05_01465 [Pontiella sp.]